MKETGVNQAGREVPVMVSLTSVMDRFKDLPISLYSLLNQTLKPDRVILWLSSEYKNTDNLPKNITKFIENGLEIRFVEDVKSYTKAFYAFEEFPQNIIVTADDDVFYPETWLEKLYNSYLETPEDIQVHRAHRVKITDNKIAPYETWTKHVTEETARYDNFLTGAGGVLYPPNCFTDEVLRKDIFLEKSPTADDIWFWVTALKSGRKIRVVKNHIKTLTCTNIFRQIFRCGRTLYKTNRSGANDRQLENLMKLYENDILPKLF